MGEARPLHSAELLSLLKPLLAAPTTGIVLAVSGGPDSMALLNTAATLGRQGALPPLTVGTVDHGLRRDSGDDAALVEQAAAAQGLPVHRLAWTGAKPTRALQEKARAARYRLLTDLCAAVGADHLVTAHTLDDQAETVLFRLLRGSGVAGLAAMRAVTLRDGLRHVRPLLGVAKARLVATCAVNGVTFRDDPANADPRFARTRMRQLLPMLALERCDAPALARLAMRAARAEDALAQTADAIFRDTALRLPAGMVRLDGSRLAALPAELALRVLARAVASAGDRPVRQLDGLERLATQVTDAASRGAAVKATFGGTVVTLTPTGVIDVQREGPRRRGNATPSCRPTSGCATPSHAAACFTWQA